MTDPKYFITNVKYELQGANKAIIRWNTMSDEKSDSQVEYWESGKPAQRSLVFDKEPNLTVNHRVDLTGLNPNTLYYYGAISTRPITPGTVEPRKQSIFPAPPEAETFQTPPFDWEGFFSPVSNPPAINEVNAGRTIPVEFRLGGDQGRDIFAAGYPV